MNTGIDISMLAERIAGARRRVILHAALYSRFAANPAITQALHTLLQAHRGKPHFSGVHCICLDSTLLLHAGSSGSCAWVSDFLQTLRPHAEPAELLAEFAMSDAFTMRLEMEYRGSFFRHVSRTRPNAPILIVDDLILCGHYLHSGVPAPEGCWFSIHAPVDDLFHYAETGLPPHDATLRAPFRFVADCYDAMHAPHSCAPVASLLPPPLTDCCRGLR